jgi:hypothetical protein
MAFVNCSPPHSDPVDPTTGERLASRVKPLFSVPSVFLKGRRTRSEYVIQPGFSLHAEESEQLTIRVKADGPAFLDL